MSEKELIETGFRKWESEASSTELYEPSKTFEAGALFIINYLKEANLL